MSISTAVSRVFITLCMIFSLTACNYINNLADWWKSSSTTTTAADTSETHKADKAGKKGADKGDNKADSKADKSDKPKKAKATGDIAQVSFAVGGSYAQWMPWFLANEEGTYQQFAQEYKVDIKFVTDSYQDTIKKYLDGEVDAVAVSNIDAIAQLVKHDIESDVIMITGYSNGSDAVLLPADASSDIHGKSLAAVQFSSRHYLLDRYLMRNQIGFDEVNLASVSETDMPSAFGNGQVYGVAAGNPNVDKLVREQKAKVLFDSREIPKEISDLIVVRRETLQDHPGFAKALLATWFSVMERLQGNRRGPTLDKMAGLANLSREDYDRQLTMVTLNDTPTKALSAIRDRAMRKSMRYIRYFIERHNLTGSEAFTGWVSYPGRTPALLHYNAQPLQNFVAPPLDTEAQ